MNMYVKTLPEVIQHDVPAGNPKIAFLANEKEAKVKWCQDISQLSILEQLKPAWLALKTLGLLPIFKEQPVKESRVKKIALFARQAAYPLGVYLTSVTGMCGVLLQLRRLYALKGSTLSTTIIVYHLMCLVYTAPPALIAPLLWARMGHVLQFFKDWNKFQARFLEVTRHPLELGMRRLATVVVILVTFGTIAAWLSFFLRPLTRGKYLSAFFYGYAMIQINTLLAVWVLLCHASAKAADQLARRTSEKFRKAGVLGEHVVYDLRHVWLLLSQLTRDIGTMFCSVFNVIVFTWLSEMLLTAFQIATLMANDCLVTSVIGVAGFGFLALGSIQIFCHAASLATEAVSGKIKNCLQEIQVNRKDIQTQLQVFELAVEVQDVTINLGGYYDVNRSLVVSILSAFATFSVVLFQSITPSDSDVCGSGNAMPQEQNGTKL